MKAKFLKDGLLYLYPEDEEDEEVLEILWESCPDFVGVIAPVMETGEDGPIVTAIIGFDRVMLKTELLDRNLDPKSPEELSRMAESVSRKCKVSLEEFKRKYLQTDG